MSSQDQKHPGAGIEFYGGYQVYSESGIDLTLLRRNLQRSLAERWENNRRALGFGNALRRAMLQPGRNANSSTGQEEPVLNVAAVIQLLASHQVEFVVVGGQAMRAHGSAHVTDDMDFCYRRTPANCAALAAALQPIHPYLRGVPPGLPFTFDAPTILAGLNFTLTTDLGDVDFLGEISGVGNYEKVLAQSVELTEWGLKIRVLSLDGLIAAKRAAGRVKDRNHLLELEELKKLRDANP